MLYSLFLFLAGGVFFFLKKKTRLLFKLVMMWLFFKVTDSYMTLIMDSG